MKLFYKPGACSMASHIVLHEIGDRFDIETVDTSANRTATGIDYGTINSKAYVPALQFDDGTTLTEGPAILQHLADSAPDTGLLPAPGSMARARVLEVLTFVSSELHKAFAPLFNAAATDAEKADARTAVGTKFDYVETLLGDKRDTVLSGQFTIADAYLFVVSNWANGTGIDLARWPNLAAFVDRVAQRPATRAALQAEGLLP